MNRIVVAILVILSLGVAVNAQTFRGAINGTVTDPSGGAVPNAQVKAENKATALVLTTTTTSEGQFAFQDIAIGTYKVSVSASGFATTTADNVEVSAGQVYTLNIQVKVGQATSVVEVSAAAITLDTTTTTQSTDLSSGLVQDVPLNGRDFTQLITIQPGFGGYNVGGFGSVNGTRPNQVNWQIDGVDNNDFWHNVPAVNQGGVSGIAGIILPVDSIEEFSAQTQSGPEGGRNAGGTVNVVTKSGGNTIHGSVYYYNRNEAFAANSPFFSPSSTTPKAPPLRNENYGMSFGGPIRKDKLFYFLSYEKQDYLIGVSGIATEPSDAWIKLAQNLLSNTDPVTGAANAFGSYAAVPQSTFSTAAIQPSGFWPRGSASGSISGLPATPNNYFAPVASIGYSYNGVGRADYNINSKHRLYLRFFGGQGNQIAPLGASPALGTASSNLKYYFESAPIHVFNYSLVLNSAFSARWTNQVLVGTNYFNQVFSDANHSFNTQTMGLFLSPDATNKGQYIIGAPNISISGFEQVGLTPPEGRNDITWHVTDIVSHTVGAHQLRLGGEVRQVHLNEFYHRRGTGKFTFDGTAGPWASAAGCAGATKTSGPAGCQALIISGQLADAESLADFLAGDAGSGTIAVGTGAGPERWVIVNAFNLYAQDDWQVTKRFNFNYGLRYEYFGPMHSNRKDIANFIPGSGLLIQGNGLDSLFNPNRANFAPRIGFAYQPGYGGYAKDLVVRGAFGVFYDQINMNPFLDFRPPITAAQGIQGNPIGPNAVSTFSAPFCGTLPNTNVTPAATYFQWDAVQSATCPTGYSNAGATNSSASVFGPALVCADPLCATEPDGLNLFAVNHNFKTPYFFNYSLQIEKGLGNKAVFQIGYVGSEGRKLNIVSNINQGNAVSSHFGSILQLNSAGTSNYNSLQTTFRLREWRGLTSQFAYTWSHSLDEVSEYLAVILDDAFNRKLDYGNGDYDTRHSFAGSLTYRVPKAQWATGWKDYLVNGWQASSELKFNTGQPYDEVLSGLYLVGDPFQGVSHNFDKSIPGVQWINPAAFSAPCVLSATITSCPAGVGTDPNGNISRNKFHGPGFADVDLSVFKNIPITERFKVQLRAEMFNTFNRKNLANSVGAVANSPCHPTLDPTAANPFLCTAVKGFGQVTDTAGDFQGAPGIGPGEPFNLQLAIKVIF